MLTAIESRVLGCLLEKERTVPDQYPLTLNTLVTACNQSTSREPVMHLIDHDVEVALASLKAQGLLRYVHPAHGRSVTRYRQVADEAWGLDAPASALIGVLLLRGPQTSAELRSRTERWHSFESAQQLETAMFELVAASMVEALPRQPGHKEHRWRQLLAEAVDVPVDADAVSPVERSAHADAQAGPSTADRLAAVERRVARLESVLADLLPTEDAADAG